MKKININSYVYVKLTNLGIQLYIASINHRLANNAPKHLFIDENYVKSKINNDGYIEFQLWEFMRIFGEMLYIGNPNNFFEMEIAFDNKDLIDL